MVHKSKNLSTERGKDEPCIIKLNQEISSDIRFTHSQMNNLNCVLFSLSQELLINQ